MADDKPKKPKPQERVRYEVYGMPVEDIIANAIQADPPPAPAAPEPEPEPAWPSLEELKSTGPRVRTPGTRGRR